MTISRGWRVVVGLFLVLCTSAGLGFYGLSVYLSALNRTRGFSVSGMSGATAVYFIFSGVSGIGIARLLRSVDPRPIVIAGAFVAAASMVTLGRVHELWQVYVVYAFFGCGYAATALIVSTTLVARWFDRKRAVALSIASTGLSVGGIVMTPLARKFLHDFSIEAATTRIAILYIVGIVPACMIFLRPDPARYGEGPDGVALSSTGDSPNQQLTQRNGAEFDHAVKSPAFRAITIGFLCALGAQVGGIAQLDKLAHERIASESSAARILSIVAFCSVVGRLSGSVIVSRIGARRFTFAVLALQSVGLGLFAFASGSFAVTLTTVVFGLMIGNVLLLHPLLLATTFGVRDYPRIYGRSQFYTTLGVAGGPFLYGFLRDHAGGYRTAYVVGAAVTLLGVFAYAQAAEVTNT
jgi:MFS family permease